MSHRRKKTEASAPCDIPPAPKELPKSAAAVWNEIAPLLATRGRLTPCDIRAFEVLCRTYANWRIAVGHVEKDGAVEDGRYGTKATAWVAIANQTAATLNQYLSHFMLSPMSRIRGGGTAGEPKQEEESPVS